ncbi:MAG TPA: hypothetical protein VN721_09195 [Flavipsychrobacter sp.]|nr:hypothetical protein [Flavipsychrobacter sp.]
MGQFITLIDYLLLPFYLVLVYVIAYNFRNRKYPVGHPWRPYFMPGFTAKIVGSIFIGLIYQYYYGGGDTSNYFYHAEVINYAFGDSIVKWFNLLFHIPHWYSGEYSDYISLMYWYDAPSEYTVCCITAFLSIFTFTTFLPTSIIFGSLAFTGTWALFRTFATKYPLYTKYIAWCTLFIPSTIMWGSGIFKDTICMCCLGWLTYGAFRLLINRDFRISNIVAVFISFNLIAIIKIYILLAFLPALSLWILFTYSHKIQNSVGRLFVKVFVIGIAIAGFAFFSQKFAASLGKYSLQNVATTSSITRTYINSVSGDSGSGYDLGDFDPSIGGMLKKFPLAVNVTLFSPFIWEAKKPIVLINALEALLFLWVTIKVLFQVGLGKVWRTISKDPTIQFCLIFTIVFAFAVGISSYNFGALSRYRIPCLPFYGIALVLIYYKNQPLQKNIISLK